MSTRSNTIALFMVLTIYTIENGKSVNDTIGTGKPDIDRRSMKTQCSKTIASWSSGALKHREPFLSYDASYVHSCNWKTLPRPTKRRDALIQNSYIESLEASESFNSILYLFTLLICLTHCLSLYLSALLLFNLTHTRIENDSTAKMAMAA